LLAIMLLLMLLIVVPPFLLSNFIGTNFENQGTGKLRNTYPLFCLKFFTARQKDFPKDII